MSSAAGDRGTADEERRVGHRWLPGSAARPVCTRSAPSSKVRAMQRATAQSGCRRGGRWATMRAMSLGGVAGAACGVGVGGPALRRDRRVWVWDGSFFRQRGHRFACGCFGGLGVGHTSRKHTDGGQHRGDLDPSLHEFPHAPTPVVPNLDAESNSRAPRPACESRYSYQLSQRSNRTYRQTARFHQTAVTRCGRSRSCDGSSATSAAPTFGLCSLGLRPWNLGPLRPSLG